MKFFQLFLKEEADYAKVTEWKNKVKEAYPKLAGKFKFKSRSEGGKNLIYAEIDGEDRCYGVFDLEKEEGEVLGESIKENTMKLRHLIEGVTPIFKNVTHDGITYREITNMKFKAYDGVIKEFVKGIAAKKLGTSESNIAIVTSEDNQINVSAAVLKIYKYLTYKNKTSEHGGYKPLGKQSGKTEYYIGTVDCNPGYIDGEFDETDDEDMYVQDSYFEIALYKTDEFSYVMFSIDKSEWEPYYLMSKETLNKLKADKNVKEFKNE